MRNKCVGFLLMLLVAQNVSCGQQFSSYLTDKEVNDFLKWETSEVLNFRTSLFERDAMITMLDTSNEWHAELIFEKDSAQHVDRFNEIFKLIKLTEIVSKEDLKFLRKQYSEVKPRVHFRTESSKVHLVSKVANDNVTVIYSTPLSTSDKKIFFLLKEYTWNKERGEVMIQVYKKSQNGKWSLFKAESIVEY